jgi:hypothetical protein
MEIRFVSSLTAEDENLFAPGLLKAVGAILDQLPIAYTIRIETTGSQVFQHTKAGPEERAKAGTFEVPNGAPNANFASVRSLVARPNGHERS